MIASPCVALISRFRRPIRPRAGIEEFQVGVGPLHVHLGHLAPAGADQLHHRADVAVRHVDDEELVRLVLDAVDLLDDDLGLADGQLVALAAHGLDQDREVQQAPARDLERVARPRSARPGGRRSIPARGRAGPSGGES